MNDQPSTHQILIMGIGNLVQSDDGFGVHIIRAFSSNDNKLPDNVEILDAGTSIVDHLSNLILADYLICVDVAAGGKSPGTIYRFRPEDITYKKSRFHNAHKISIFDALKMVEAMKGKTPDTLIYAVEPENIEWGIEMSPTLQKVMPEVMSLIDKEIHSINTIQQYL